MKRVDRIALDVIYPAVAVEVSNPVDEHENVGVNSEPALAIRSSVIGHDQSARDDILYLRSLTMHQRAELIRLACRSASAIYQSRLAAGLRPEEPTPWPASTLEFLRNQTANVRRTKS